MQDLLGGRIDYLCGRQHRQPQIDGGTVKGIAIMTGRARPPCRTCRRQPNRARPIQPIPERDVPGCAAADRGEAQQRHVRP
jgi:hypothetical protein